MPWPDPTGAAAGVWITPAGDGKGDVPASLLEDAEAAYIETVDADLIAATASILTTRGKRGDVLLARVASGGTA